MSSSGGHIALSHTACSGLVQLDSSGGDVTVDGLEGSASILTAGGAVKVHLHERAQSVFVDSGGGNVEAWISPVAAGSLSVAAGGGVDVDPALKVWMHHAVSHAVLKCQNMNPCCTMMVAKQPSASRWRSKIPMHGDDAKPARLNRTLVGSMLPTACVHAPIRPLSTSSTAPATAVDYGCRSRVN